MAHNGILICVELFYRIGNARACSSHSSCQHVSHCWPI